MDQLFTLGKQTYSQFEAGQGQQSQQGIMNVQGGTQYNQPGNQSQQYGGNMDISNAAQHAANDSGQDSGLFHQAMSHIQNVQTQGNTDVDEDHIQQAHNQAYNQNSGSSLGANSMGAAAAMQALKMFTGGQASGQSSAVGGSQSAMIGMAMSQAAKLFDQSGGSANGSKQDVVISAGQTMMKLILKNQMPSMMGGSNSGGLGGLMSMAGNFM